MYGPLIAIVLLLRMGHTAFGAVAVLKMFWENLCVYTKYRVVSQFIKFINGGT